MQEPGTSMSTSSPWLEGDNAVPLGLVNPLVAAVSVDVTLVGGDAQVGHLAPPDAR